MNFNEPETPLSIAIIKRIEDIGRARQLIDELLRHECFDDLSKHNAYWDSEHEIESDKLDDLRRRLSAIQDHLADISSILDNE